MRRIVVYLSAILQSALFAGAGTPAQAGPPRAFSAEVMVSNGGGEPLAATATLHAADHKVRIEIGPRPDGFFLSDSDAGTAIYVRSAQRLYLDAGQSTPLSRIFVAVDPHHPCRQWQTAAATAGIGDTGEWHCEPTQTSAGKRSEIVQYRVATSDGPPSYGWVDSRIGFPVKWQGADGKVFELRNIRPEAQPASLFSVPSSYRKLDPHALLERIKHSDVWPDSSK